MSIVRSSANIGGTWKQRLECGFSNAEEPKVCCDARNLQGVFEERPVPTFSIIRPEPWQSPRLGGRAEWGHGATAPSRRPTLAKHRRVGSPSPSFTHGFFSREVVRLVALDAPMERIARECFNFTGYASETVCVTCAKRKESSPWKGVSLIGPAPTKRSARPAETNFLHVANES